MTFLGTGSKKIIWLLKGHFWENWDRFYRSLSQFPHWIYRDFVGATSSRPFLRRRAINNRPYKQKCYAFLLYKLQFICSRNKILQKWLTNSHFFVIITNCNRIIQGSKSLIKFRYLRFKVSEFAKKGGAFVCTQ